MKRKAASNDNLFCCLEVWIDFVDNFAEVHCLSLYEG